MVAIKAAEKLVLAAKSAAVVGEAMANLPIKVPSRSP